jgi:hypothetical protein
VGEEVESVSGRFKHTHSCGNHKHTIVIVRKEDEFTSAVGLHPTNTKQSADELRSARGQVRGVQRMDSAVNNPARGKPDKNPDGATALNVNTNPSNARGSGGGCESYEVTFKRGEIDRACGIDYP